MPETKAMTPADRGTGVLIGTHPRDNGDLMLTPDDLMEGRGNFQDIDDDGNPNGFEIVEPPVADARNVYGGTSPDDVTRQNSAAIPIEHSSYMVNHPMVDGDDLPREGEPLAKLPRPRRPIVKRENVNRVGYPAGTDQHPHWLAFSYWRHRKHGGKLHTPLGPAVSFTGEFGQSYRVTLPDDLPEGIDGVGIWMALGPDSGASRPGDFFLQRELSLERFQAPYFDLNGPFRFREEEPDEDETQIPEGREVSAQLRSGGTSKAGVYYVKMTWALGSQEGMAGRVEGPFEIEPEMFLPEGATEPEELEYGKGRIEVETPKIPRSLDGFYLYVMLEDEWNRAYDKLTGEGLTKPWRRKKDFRIHGWGPGTEFGQDDRILLERADSPTEDESGADAPDFEPEVPTPFGASRPGPGKYFYRVTDEHRGLESIASAPTEVEISDQEVARVIFRSAVNDLPNATFVEQDANGLPLDYTVVETGGDVYMESGKIVLETLVAQTGTTPSIENELVEVDLTKQYELVFRFTVENPGSGAIAGTAQAVWRQYNAAGTITTVVLKSATEDGEYEGRLIVNPAGGSPTAWSSDTVNSSLRMQMSGATKNMRVVITRLLLKPYKWDLRRRRKRRGMPDDSDAPPNTVHPPGSSIGLELSPSPVQGAPATTIDSPDRPSSSGTALEAVSDFESALPSGWAQNVSGGGALSRNAAAAISGSSGLLLQKSAAGSLSTAFLSKTFAPPAGVAARNDAALSTRNRVGAFSGTGWVDLHRIGRPSDGRAVAWTRYVNSAEVASLTIDDAPEQPGNVAITLNGVQTNIAVIATPEVASLTINTAPTNPGSVSVTLDGQTRQIAAGGEREEFTLEITGNPYNDGTATITLDGVPRRVAIKRKDNRAEVAQRFREAQFPGWSTRAGRSRDKIVFTANLPGPRSDASYSGGNTGATATVTVNTQGAAESTTLLASRIRSTRFAGWSTGGSGTVVTFTANSAGDRINASYSGGGTGASGTMTTTTNGATDTATALAARIRAATFAGWTTGGSGTTVTFTSTTAGAKQDASYRPGPTGANGTMTTTQQGAGGDLFAMVQDTNGDVRRRRLFTSLISSTIFNVDVQVQGAGTTEGVVAFWGSFGAGTKTLLAWFDHLDLTDVPVGLEYAGVTAESATSLTWTFHVDQLNPTDRGETYFRTHDYEGNPIVQLHYHGVPTQPSIDGMPLSGFRQAVLPGEQYSFGGFFRWTGVPDSPHAKPTFLTAYTSTGQAKRLIDITGPTGITGESGWVSRERSGANAITIPNNCYLVGLDSEDVTEGTIVMQELAFSLGTVVKRTPLRESDGYYRATFLRRSTAKPSWVFWSEVRKLLQTDVTVPANSTAIVRYQSGPTAEGPWSGWSEDPTTIPDYDYIQVDVSGTSEDQKATFVIHAESPRVYYDLLVGTQSVTTLLKADRSEFLAGAVVIDPISWSAPPDVGVNRLPGGRLRRSLLFNGAEQVRTASVVVFTEEDKRYIENNWGTREFVREEYGEALTIAFAGPIQFQRRGAKYPDKDGVPKAIYVAELPPAEVLTREALPA